MSDIVWEAVKVTHCLSIIIISQWEEKWWRLVKRLHKFLFGCKPTSGDSSAQNLQNSSILFVLVIPCILVKPSSSEVDHHSPHTFCIDNFIALRTVTRKIRCSSYWNIKNGESGAIAFRWSDLVYHVNNNGSAELAIKHKSFDVIPRKTF